MVSKVMLTFASIVSLVMLIYYAPSVEDKVTRAENARMAANFYDVLPLSLPLGNNPMLGIDRDYKDTLNKSLSEKIGDLRGKIQDEIGLEVGVTGAERRMNGFRKLTIFDPFAIDGDQVMIRSKGVETKVTLSREPQTVTIRTGEFYIKALTDDVAVAIVVQHQKNPSLQKVVITPVISKGMSVAATSH